MRTTEEKTLAADTVKPRCFASPALFLCLFVFLCLFLLSACPTKKEATESHLIRMNFPHELELRDKRRRIIATLVGLVVLCGLAACLFMRGVHGPNSSEPKYQGRSLSAWLDDYANPLRSVHSRAELEKLDLKGKLERSRQAVLAIGTNALPTLLKLLQARDLPEEKLAIYGKISFTARERHHMAQAGFMILQKQALPAVPELIKLTKHEDADVRIRAFEFLIIVVNPDLKSLVPVLIPFGHDPDSENRKKGLEHMRTLLIFLSPAEAQTAGVYDAFPELGQSQNTSN